MMIHFVKGYKIPQQDKYRDNRSKFSRKRSFARARKLNAIHCTWFTIDRKQLWCRVTITDK